MDCCSWRSSFSFSGSNETVRRSKSGGVLRVSLSVGCSIRFTEENSNGFLGKPMIVAADRKGLRDFNPKASTKLSIRAQSSICVSRALRWWEKSLKPNMVEIHSSQELVDSLLTAEDRLVIVQFYSPGCGGCKALHPKMCQLAELNPKAVFLQVNYEELRKMCVCLHVHVLPFFSFYRGAEGKLCSFSCTNATIKKFKDALAKHGSDRCNVGPAKGLDESELLSLASIGEISTNLPLAYTREGRMEDLLLKNIAFSDAMGKTGNVKMGLEGDKSAILWA